MRPPILALAAVLLACGLPLRAEPVFETDQMTDDQLRKHRAAKVAELQRRNRENSSEKTPEGTAYRVFFCTLYFTPMESGFTAERGFDAAPATAPGLKGRTYPKSFLAAVKKEGFGRLREPVNGRNYLQYVDAGRYAFAKAPLGSRGNLLVPRKSCAISGRNPHLRQRMKIAITSANLQEVTGSAEWTIDDTGGGVHPLQIDLYWGEDEPLGPIGRQSARPAGTRMEYEFDAVVTVPAK